MAEPESAVSLPAVPLPAPSLPDGPPPDGPPPSRAARIVRGVAVQLGARALSTVASVFTVAITTRYLGLHNYGILTTAIVFVGLWSTLTELGVGSVIVRRVSGGAGTLDELVGANLGLSLLYSLPLAGLAMASGLAVYPGRHDVQMVVAIVSAGLALSTLSSCYPPVFVANVRFGPVALADSLSRLLILASTVVVVTLNGGLRWIGVVQLIPPLVTLAVLALAARRFGRFRPRFDWRVTLPLLRESVPITLMAFVAVLYWRADGLLLSLLSSTAQVAAYGLAYPIAFTLSVLSDFFTSSSLSTMTETFATDRTAFVRLIRSSVQAMFYVGLPIIAFSGFLAGPIVRLLASDAFAGMAAVPLALFFVAAALTFLTSVLSQALFAAHEQRFLLVVNIVNLALNIALNMVLIPHLGAVGSGIALIASELSGLAVASWRLSRVSDYRTPGAFLVRLLPAAGLGVLVLVLGRGLPVLVLIPLTGIVYVVGCALLGPVGPSTLRALLGRGEPTAAGSRPAP
ncbi:MAG TPA: flippase [Mycobacteriales bacterium]|nr:flippase [Mycobacteriales bacterium]